MLMTLGEHIGGIYGRIATLWRFLVQVCQRLEAVEQDIFLLTTPDDVKIDEEICHLHRRIDTLQAELNIMHFELSKRKKQKKRKSSKKLTSRRTSRRTLPNATS